MECDAAALSFPVTVATCRGFDLMEKVIQMADPVTEELLARLKELSGADFDAERMTKDMGYASQVLTGLSDTPDQIQGFVIMQLLRQLGLLDLSEGMGE